MKGRSKTGGRRIGSRNKVSKVNREFIQGLLSNECMNIPIALSEVFKTDKKAYLTLVLKLADIVIPKLKEQDIEENKNDRPIHIFKLKGNDKITFNHDRARDNNSAE